MREQDSNIRWQKFQDQMLSSFDECFFKVTFSPVETKLFHEDDRYSIIIIDIIILIRSQGLHNCRWHTQTEGVWVSLGYVSKFQSYRRRNHTDTLLMKAPLQVHCLQGEDFWTACIGNFFVSKYSMVSITGPIASVGNVWGCQTIIFRFWVDSY